MRFLGSIGFLGMACILVAPAPAAADAKVEIKGVHLCCGACVKGVTEAVAKVAGAKAECEQDTGIVTLTAGDAKGAEEAVKAMAAAGYHGKIEGEAAKFPESVKVPAGKVKVLKLGGLHNCCGACTRAIVDAIGEVDGVESNTVKPRATTFEVSGDFEAAALVKALNEAGFHPAVLD
jgi:copper chaperone CopZ